MCIGFVPEKRLHVVETVRVNGTSFFLPLEGFKNGRHVHNVILLTTEDGKRQLVLDLTASQYGLRDGGRLVVVSPNVEEHFALLPGRVVDQDVVTDEEFTQFFSNSTLKPTVEPLVTSVLDKFTTDVCARCGTSQGIRICSGCRSTAFCSTFCQKRLWTIHKRTCCSSSASKHLVRQDEKMRAE